MDSFFQTFILSYSFFCCSSMFALRAPTWTSIKENIGCRWWFRSVNIKQKCCYEKSLCELGMRVFIPENFLQWSNLCCLLACLKRMLFLSRLGETWYPNTLNPSRICSYPKALVELSIENCQRETLIYDFIKLLISYIALIKFPSICYTKGAKICRTDGAGSAFVRRIEEQLSSMNKRAQKGGL